MLSIALPHLVLALVLAACTESAPAPLPSIEPQATVVSADEAADAPVIVPSDGASVAYTTDSTTAAAYREIMDAADAAGVSRRSYGEIVQWTAEQLLGRPYVAGLLDAPEQETLVLDLTRFDCVLLIENVLAIARQIALGERGYDGYAAGVQALRYRDGQMDGYCSRLHYFTDWIRDNQRRGAMADVTQQIGGEVFDKRLDFMSTHRGSYPRLASDEVYACVVGTERALAAGGPAYHLPEARIAAAYDGMQPGDIVATTTSIGGLDVTHTGFVHRDGRRTGFLHASSASNAVKISPDLQAYVEGIRSQVGVVIVRPSDPRLSRASGASPAVGED